MISVFMESDAFEVDISLIRDIAALVVNGEIDSEPGDLNIVLVNDLRIKELNRDFLNKDRITDVIAFPLDDKEDSVWGEIYISVQRAHVQALDYEVQSVIELARLIIHGVLHLAGFDDIMIEDKIVMTTREDYYLEQCLEQELLPPKKSN
ncbi:rRNA maturation RNase YbeY [bacterium]|nr:rRNA maturation RNase YbeY [bacterium]